MSHNIMKHDGIAMVRKPSWHGLEKRLFETPPAHFLDLMGPDGADLLWPVTKTPLIARFADGNEQESGLYAITRPTSDGQHILGTCTKQHVLFQNGRLGEHAQTLVDTGYWTYESAGSLKNGQYVWILLKRGETEIVPGDIYKEHTLLMSAHTGKDANYVMDTMIRVQCWNTLSRAIFGREHKHRAPHFRSLPTRMEAIEKMYLEQTETFNLYRESLRQLAEKPMSEAQLAAYVDSLFPIAEGLEGKALTIAQSTHDTAWNFVVGNAASGVQSDRTALTAFNGVTEFTEHYLGQGRVADRGQWILQGGGLQFQQQAFALAQLQ